MCATASDGTVSRMGSVDDILDDLTGELAGPYYDRDGQQIPLRRKRELDKDRSYKIVHRTPVSRGVVLSVWLGSNMVDGEEEPYTFGTALLPDTGLGIEHEQFARNVEEALDQHTALVLRLELRAGGRVATAQEPVGTSAAATALEVAR